MILSDYHVHSVFSDGTDTLEDIAERLGISKSTVFKYVKGKEE